MNRFGEGHGGRAEFLAHRIGQDGRRRFLPDFLTAALQRAFAFETVDGALAVAQHLHFNMAGLGDDLLDIKSAIAEGSQSLTLRLRQQLREFRPAAGDADAASTAPGRGLDHDGKTDAFGDLRRFIQIIDAPAASRHDRDARFLGGDAGLDLVAHGADGLGAGADKDHPGLVDGFGEARILGEEAVARMDGVGARLLRRIDDNRNIEIGFRRMRRADIDGLIGQLHGKRWVSAALCAWMVRMPNSRAALMMRTAISPRLAMKRDFSMGASLNLAPHCRFPARGRRARTWSALKRWIAKAQ